MNICIDCKKEICLKAKRCKICFLKKFQKAGTDSQRIFFSYIERKQISYAFKHDMTLSEIAKLFKCSINPIRNILIFDLKDYKDFAKKHQLKSSLKNLKKARNTHSRISKEEIIFRKNLEDKNIRFFFQFQIHNWKVDFLILPNIIVQIDGVYWHCRIFGNQLKDWLQTQKLKEMGYKVIRFWDFEINENIENCIERLEKFIIS